MQQETMKILQMIADGAITAEEGETLLLALRQPVEPLSPPIILDPDLDRDALPPMTPDVPNWAKFWPVPLAVGALLASLGIAYTVLAFNGSINPWWLILTLSSLLWGVFFMVFGWLMRTSHWLHVNIKDDSTRFKLSFPLPLGWMGWIGKCVQPWVPQLKELDFDLGELLSGLSNELAAAGFWIDVNESDNERVQIYYG